MANRVFNMVRNDTKPPLQVQILNPDGTPQNLVGHSVVFNMKKGSVLKVNAAAISVDGSNGIYEHRWSAADTDTVGQYRAQFVVDGIDSYPKDGYITVLIIEDLA